VKGFLLMLSFLTFTCGFSNEVTVLKGMETKVKYNCNKIANYLRLENIMWGHARSDSAYAEADIKLVLQDADSCGIPVNIDFDRLLVGYQMASAPEIFIEAGRIKMDHIFNSKLQYHSHFNGLHAGLAKDNISAHGGIHIVTSDMDHYGFVGEIQHTGLMNLPLKSIYSLISWGSDTEYLISQLGGEYALGTVSNKSISVYGAFLRNHRISSHSNGYYIGAKLGEIKVAKDWLVDLHYQNTGIYTIPFWDYQGIGNGMQLKVAYAITDQCTAQAKANVVSGGKNQLEFCMAYKW